MGSTAEIFSASGILKVLEVLISFIAIMIHRYGDYGRAIFFGTSSEVLAQVKSYYFTDQNGIEIIVTALQNDPGTDAENLGNGVLVAYLIISAVLLVAYVIDTRYVVQSFFLESVSKFSTIRLLSKRYFLHSFQIWLNGF